MSHALNSRYDNSYPHRELSLWVWSSACTDHLSDLSPVRIPGDFLDVRNGHKLRGGCVSCKEMTLGQAATDAEYINNRYDSIIGEAQCDIRNKARQLKIIMRFDRAITS